MGAGKARWVCAAGVAAVTLTTAHALAGAVMLVGALATFVIVGTKKNSVEFLIATDGEMKKVNWTSYREVKGSTIVVIAATFLIAGFLFVVDLAFSNFFSWIDVLQK